MTLKRTLHILTACMTIPSAFAAEEFAYKVGGFIDPQFNWTKATTTNPGFVLNDAAIYFSSTYDSAFLKIDLPFNSQSTSTTQNGNFNFALSKAQAFVGYTCSCGLTTTLGQFDTIFGFETNDSLGQTFAKSGLVYANLPTIHTGAMLEFKKSYFFGRALVSDPNSSNGLFASGKRLEWGGMLGLSHDKFRFSTGILTNKPAANNRYLLINVLGGVTWQKLAVDLEFDSVKNISASVRGWQLLANVVYGITDALSAGARFEFTKNTTVTSPSVLTTNRALQLTLGPQYQIVKNLKAKFDYSWNSTRLVAGGTKTTTHAMNLAAVYSFGSL